MFLYWHDSRSNHPATRIMFLYWHMTGEVIIQLSGYCLYTERRSHHPATRMFLYWHMTGEVIIQLPRYCLCTNIWQEKSPSSYPDTVSVLTYDRRSHHPATQIMSLCSHMTGEVTIQIMSLCSHMTGEVVLHASLHYWFYTETSS
jgi:hypothetical protein